MIHFGTSLVVQCWESAFHCRDTGSIPGQETKASGQLSPQAATREACAQLLSPRATPREATVSTQKGQKKFNINKQFILCCVNLQQWNKKETNKQAHTSLKVENES